MAQWMVPVKGSSCVGIWEVGVDSSWSSHSKASRVSVMSQSSVKWKGDSQWSQRGSLGKEGWEGLFGSILCDGKAISKAFEMSFCSLATLSLLGLKGVPLIKFRYGSFDARSERYSFVVDERRIVRHQKERGEK